MIKIIVKIFSTLAAGGFDGVFGSDLVKLFDENKDGKVSISELWRSRHKLKELTPGQVVKLLVSTGISVFAFVKAF